ncbi:MAG: hydratase [Pseudolabrys sp.]|nr:hydratase [Pseudolabrys sp.]
MSDTRINDIATEALAALAAHTPLAPFSGRGLTLADASRVTPLLRAAFEARGEDILGRKIGFTNRSIWDQYGVHAPIWGYITSATTHDLSAMPSLSARDFSEPRLEPEIMFGLKAAPTADMDDDALMACIDWLALGFEVVQSPFPDWQFKPADTVAVNALHGALLIGERHAFAPRAADWQRELASFTATLSCDGKVIDVGGGAAVLDSPLLALRHLLGMLANDPHNPPLAVGEIISTGTLTKAMPVKAGETWRIDAIGIPLPSAALRFV